MSIGGPDILRRLKHLIPRSLLRYGIVGIVQNGAFYLIALGLLTLGWEAWQAVLVLNPLAVAASFLANRTWSFADREHERGAVQFVRYVVLYGGTYAFAVGLTWVLESLGMPSWLALLVTVGAAATILYGALNLWVFRSGATSKRPPMAS